MAKKKKTVEERKVIARRLRGPHKVTGRGRIVGGLTDTQLSDIRKLRSNKKSNLYSMPKQKFRKWFHGKYDFFYPYNIPKKKI